MSEENNDQQIKRKLVVPAVRGKGTIPFLAKKKITSLRDLADNAESEVKKELQPEANSISFLTAVNNSNALSSEQEETKQASIQEGISTLEVQSNPVLSDGNHKNQQLEESQQNQEGQHSKESEHDGTKGMLKTEASAIKKSVKLESETELKQKQENQSLENQSQETKPEVMQNLGESQNEGELQAHEKGSIELKANAENYDGSGLANTVQSKDERVSEMIIEKEQIETEKLTEVFSNNAITKEISEPVAADRDLKSVNEGILEQDEKAASEPGVEIKDPKVNEETLDNIGSQVSNQNGEFINDKDTNGELIVSENDPNLTPPNKTIFDQNNNGVKTSSNENMNGVNLTEETKLIETNEDLKIEAKTNNDTIQGDPNPQDNPNDSDKSFERLNNQPATTISQHQEQDQQEFDEKFDDVNGHPNYNMITKEASPNNTEAFQASETQNVLDTKIELTYKFEDKAIAEHTHIADNKNPDDANKEKAETFERNLSSEQNNPSMNENQTESQITEGIAPLDVYSSDNQKRTEAAAPQSQEEEFKENLYEENEPEERDQEDFKTEQKAAIEPETNLENQPSERYAEPSDPNESISCSEINNQQELIDGPKSDSKEKLEDDRESEKQCVETDELENAEDPKEDEDYNVNNVQQLKTNDDNNMPKFEELNNIMLSKPALGLQQRKSKIDFEIDIDEKKIIANQSNKDEYVAPVVNHQVEDEDDFDPNASYYSQSNKDEKINHNLVQNSQEIQQQPLKSIDELDDINGPDTDFQKPQPGIEDEIHINHRKDELHLNLPDNESQYPNQQNQNVPREQPKGNPDDGAEEPSQNFKNIENVEHEEVEKLELTEEQNLKEEEAAVEEDDKKSEANACESEQVIDENNQDAQDGQDIQDVPDGHQTVLEERSDEVQNYEDHQSKSIEEQQAHESELGGDGLKDQQNLEEENEGKNDSSTEKISSGAQQIQSKHGASHELTVNTKLIALPHQEEEGDEFDDINSPEPIEDKSPLNKWEIPIQPIQPLETSNNEVDRQDAPDNEIRGNVEAQTTLSPQRESCVSFRPTADDDKDLRSLQKNATEQTTEEAKAETSSNPVQNLFTRNSSHTLIPDPSFDNVNGDFEESVKPISISQNPEPNIAEINIHQMANKKRESLEIKIPADIASRTNQGKNMQPSFQQITTVEPQKKTDSFSPTTMSPSKKATKESANDKGRSSEDIMKKLKTSGKYDSQSFLARIEMHQKDRERNLNNLREKVTSEKEIQEKGNLTITPRSTRNHINSPRADTSRSNQRSLTPDKSSRTNVSELIVLKSLALPLTRLSEPGYPKTSRSDVRTKTAVSPRSNLMVLAVIGTATSPKE